jgi:hypothetical protein
MQWRNFNLSLNIITRLFTDVVGILILRAWNYKVCCNIPALDFSLITFSVNMICYALPAMLLLKSHDLELCSLNQNTDWRKKNIRFVKDELLAVYLDDAKLNS